VAIDSARWALRLAKDVTVLYRRDQAQMPAYPEEVEAAAAEGLKFVFRALPVALDASHQGSVEKVKYVTTAPSDLGSDGRQLFSVASKGETELPARTVILALGQESEAESWAAGLGIEGMSPDRTGRLAPGLYAIGDLVTGPATVVEAMAGGVASAHGILREVSS
jgi:NADPH-dependent glutamate synthase beta subunit-like oxidoreductase